MGRILVLAVVSCLVLVSAVFADVKRPTLPKGQKVAEPTVRFEGIDKHPDYVFYLSYSASDIFTKGSRKLDNQTSYEKKLKEGLIQVTERKGIKLNLDVGKDRAPIVQMVLLAMERKAFDERKKEDPSLQWLASREAGVLAWPLAPPETTVPVSVKELPVTIYVVTLKLGLLRAEKMESKKGGEQEPATLLPPWTFGIAGSLSIAWLGVWLARRRNLPATGLSP